MLRLSAIFVVAAALTMLVGCGDGVPRTHLSGKVTFKNAPVAQGYITFVPDPASNKSGAQGSAPIKDGAYDTRQGTAPSPGALIVRIDGFDGKANDDQPAGNPILFWEEKMELTAQTTTKDFVVPDKAPKTQPQDGGKQFIVP